MKREDLFHPLKIRCETSEYQMRSREDVLQDLPISCLLKTMKHEEGRGIEFRLFIECGVAISYC